MFCPSCGKEIFGNGAEYCPHCEKCTGHMIGRAIYLQTTATSSDEDTGKNINRDSTLQSPESNRIPTIKPASVPPKPKNKQKYAAIATVLMVLSVGCVLAFAEPYSDENGNLENADPTKPIVISSSVGGDLKLELLTGFLGSNSPFSAKFNESDELEITLNPELSRNYDFYNWTLRGTYYLQDQTVSKEESTLYWTKPTAGEYTVSVMCSIEGRGGYDYKETYVGQFEYAGTVEKVYDWTYQSQPYSMAISYDYYDDFIKYSEMNKDDRSIVAPNYRNSVMFVEVEHVVQSIADNLVDLYKESYGSDQFIRTQEFANFVLAYVQICFDYPPNSNSVNGDQYIYGQNEYFAYPMETIYYGVGDCEDTAILCAAIFDACGLDAAICIIPRHAVAGIALESYTEPNHVRSVELVSQEVNGKTYYGCETTIDNGVRNVGLLNTSGNYNASLTGTIAEKNGYGFFPV